MEINSEGKVMCDTFLVFIFIELFDICLLTFNDYYKKIKMTHIDDR